MFGTCSFWTTTFFPFFWYNSSRKVRASVTWSRCSYLTRSQTKRNRRSEKKMDENSPDKLSECSAILSQQLIKFEHLFISQIIRIFSRTWTRKNTHSVTFHVSTEHDINAYIDVHCTCTMLRHVQSSAFFFFLFCVPTIFFFSTSLPITYTHSNSPISIHERENRVEHCVYDGHIATEVWRTQCYVIGVKKSETFLLASQFFGLLRTYSGVKDVHRTSVYNNCMVGLGIQSVDVCRFSST